MSEERKMIYRAMIHTVVDNTTVYRQKFQNEFSAYNHVLRNFEPDRLGFLIPYGVIQVLEPSTQKWIVKSILINSMFDATYKEGKTKPTDQWKADYYNIHDMISKRVLLDRMPSEEEIQKEMEHTEVTHAVISYLYQRPERHCKMVRGKTPRYKNPRCLDNDTWREYRENEKILYEASQEPQFNTHQVILNNRYQGLQQMQSNIVVASYT